MTTETGFRLQVMTPAGEWVEVTDPADPILARVGEDFRARQSAPPGCDRRARVLPRMPRRRRDSRRPRPREPPHRPRPRVRVALDDQVCA